MKVSIARICRYPVKGLSSEELSSVVLSVGQALPHDRRFALALPDTSFDPTKPEWLPKTKFLMLMRDEKLAQLHTRFDDGSGYLTIDREDETLLKANITEPSGKATAGNFFAEFMSDSVEGTPRVVEAAGHTFSDAQQKPNSTTYQYVSIVNLASVRALEEAAGAPVDPIRFRSNLYVDGLPAWEELDWIGSDISVGNARLSVVSQTIRCAATAVNPDTAERDLNILKILKQSFGHVCMGIYAEVTGSGEVAVGDPLHRYDDYHT